MNRYQVYLNPHSVAILDDFENISDISRSKLIRGAIDRLADQLAKIFAVRTDRLPKLTHLDKLVGSIHLKTKKATQYAHSIDDIYLTD